MSDSDPETDRTSVNKTPRLHRRREDYIIWLLRLRSTRRVSGLWNNLEKEASSSTSTTTIIAATITDSERMSIEAGKGSGMMICALGNSPLCVVADADDNPARMLELLDERYASKHTVSSISVQTLLFRMRYSVQHNSKFIDEYTDLFSQLEFMGKDIAIQEEHKAAMLLASVDPSSKLEPIAAALRTKDAAELTWEYVDETLIDEYNARYGSSIKYDKLGKKWRNRKVKESLRATTIEDGGMWQL